MVFETSRLKQRGVRVVHVAGTKGKGSTCSYIAAALHAQGFRVGIFTSPHLHTVRERIKIGPTLITRDDFVRIAEIAIKLMEPLVWPLFFDVSLCMALLYFGEQSVDYIVLETGIGGEYDSTNFIEAPVASVITNIGLDHQNILGDTIEEIAAQKAGIIKKGRPIFTTSHHPPAVMEVFRTKAAFEQSELHIVPCDASIPIRLGMKVEYYPQIENICLSAAVLEYLGVSGCGMRQFYWPCRMEQFVVDGVDIIVDGNHNDESVRLFLDGVRKLRPASTIVVIFGCGTDKNLDLMVAELGPRADAVMLAQSNHFKSSSKSSNPSLEP
jgi:dihydrofolate synthase/folylpolyglutamate synthase